MAFNKNIARNLTLKNIIDSSVSSRCVVLLFSDIFRLICQIREEF